MLNSIQLPTWLSTGMVFQQGVPLMLHGYTQPHMPVKLEVVKDPTDGRKVSKLDTDYGIILTKEYRADDEGRFFFELPPYKPSTDAYTFIFSAMNLVTVTIKDLRCGDVWLMLGSVPFSIPISKTKAPRTPLKDSTLQLIRFFTFSDKSPDQESDYSYNPVSTLKEAAWVTLRNQSALANASAVGFSYGYHLADQLRYPIGIVDLALEDSAIYSWISRTTFESEPELLEILKEKKLFLDEDDWQQWIEKELAPPKVELFSGDPSEDELKVVENKVASAEITPALKTTKIVSETPMVGNKKLLSELPKPHVDKKIMPSLDVPYERLMTALYNHRIHPLKDMSLRGIVFAPDEKDSFLADRYADFLESMLSDLSSTLGPRKIKSRKNIPSLILLQVRPAYTEPSDRFRLVYLNEALSVIKRRLPMPIGILSQHDMLLPDKSITFQIGRRLSAIALGIHFTPKMPKSSPECVSIESIGNKIMLTFNNTCDGLRLAENESVLRGFSVCGEDRIYYPAQAKILHGVRVMVWNDDVTVPTGVNYGFQPIPSDATFRNRTDLPVLPFRSDREEAQYAPDLTFTNCDQLTFVGLENKDSQFSPLPIYEIYKGHGKIFLETLNKTEGSGALRIEYGTDKGSFSFGPILRYASLYAPLNLGSFHKIRLDIFNPDQNEKRLSASGFYGSVPILPKLMWQTLTLEYDSNDPMMMDHLEITISDVQKKGSIYIDNIRFIS